MAARSVFAAEAGDMNADLASYAAALNGLASRCDAMCLTAGVQLGNAAPGLSDLSNQFASLSAMLVAETGANPAQSLECVAKDIMTIGAALSTERDAVAALIAINAVLSQRIVGLAEHVRFLSAVVSNVKIEIATIDEGEHRLEGFADNLKQLASKSESTVTAFQGTHERLIKQLQRTSMAQAAFVTSHGAKFTTASREISASLGAVSDRRKAVSGIAGEIGTLTQKIGARIAQCVVALQIGDSTRQRVEHAGEALAIAGDIVAGRLPDGLADDELLDEAPDDRGRMAARICLLGTVQTTEATKEFSGEITTISKLIQQITAASSDLKDRSRMLVSGPDNGAPSFLADLEGKLASAGDLIEECGKSRKLVDDTAEQVIASVGELQDLAKSVADMATDMMIIGTNAVVTSYRLGTKGIPLSVIAQHLRSHAVHVTDAVKLVSPALDKVREAARAFTSAREGRDANAMGNLASRIAEALAAFQEGDRAVADVHAKLAAEVASAGTLLRQASDALDHLDEINADLGRVVQTIEALAGEAPDLEDDVPIPPSLDHLLRKRYTMGSERALHDKVFGTAAPHPLPPAELEADAAIWL